MQLCCKWSCKLLWTIIWTCKNCTRRCNLHHCCAPQIHFMSSDFSAFANGKSVLRRVPSNLDRLLSHEYSVDITTCLRTSKDVGSTSTCLQDTALWTDCVCASPQNALWLPTSLWLNTIIAFRGYLNNLCTLFGVQKQSKARNWSSKHCC